jgi:hypothetical protein
VLQQLFVGVELAVFAGVVERDVSVGALFFRVDLATIEGFRVHVDAHGALIEFRQIQNLMNRFQGIHVNGMRSVHLVDFCRNDFAFAAGSVFVFHAEILDFQTAHGGGHPAVLVAMIVNAAGLADFPADGHALEEFVFENEIACVIPSGEEKIFVERLRPDRVTDNVVLHVFESEVALGDGGKAFDPVCDGELFDSEFFWHGRGIITPNEQWPRGQKRKYSAKHDIL